MPHRKQFHGFAAYEVRFDVGYEHLRFSSALGCITMHVQIGEYCTKVVRLNAICHLSGYIASASIVK
jgi:hypothetical protein